jgi:TIR domain
MAAGVFISFRPEDSAWAARISEQVSSSLGRDRLILDYGATAHDAVFASNFAELLGRLDAIVVVIGKNWLTKTLDDPNDHLHMVLELTFECGIAVISVLVDDPVQSVVWRGESAYCQFLATIPAGTSGQTFFAVLRLSVDGRLTGSIKFRLSSDAAAPQPTSEPLGDHAKLHQYAFVSYASKDRKEVLKRVQMLEVLKTKFFQDILSLDPGDRWEKKLYENIDRCDLFLLFWSQAAKDSQWVLKEAEYALAHQGKNPNSEPDLVPVVLEQHVLPPPSLSGFHFADRISYLTSLMP